MRVILYKYNGASDVVNKVDNAAVVYDSADTKDFEVYGGFSPYAAEFELSSLHSANFCRYLYSGIWYYGSVVVSTTSRGLYKYTVTVDPLTTAWYLGCLNVNAMVQYAPMTDIIQYDPRIPISEDSKVIFQSCEEMTDLADPAIILTVVDPYGQATTKDKSFWQTPSATRAYLFLDHDELTAVENFKNFIKNIAQVDSTPFKDMSPALASIQSTYVVPKTLVTNGDETQSRTITLHCIPSDIWESGLSNNIHISSGGDGQLTYGVDEISTQSASAAPVLSFNWEIEEHKHFLSWNSEWCVIIPYVCELRIVPSQIMPLDAHRLLVEVGLNVIGGFYTVRLGYVSDSGTYYFHDNIQSFPVQEKIQFPRANHENNAIFGALSGAVSTLANVATKNYVGAVQSGLSTASSIKSAITGSCATTGQLGGSVSRNAILAIQHPHLCINYRPYEAEQHTFAQKFGYPCNKVMNIQNIPSGYIQTSDIVLDCCGLPDDIVKAAQDMCNAGFRKV